MAAESGAAHREPIVMLHPEDTALREELARLRAEMTVLLLQKDDLELVQGRRIEAAYLKRFGALELEVYESFCDYRREKRKADEIRARRNRREPVDEAEVTAALDGEFAVYREKLHARMEKMNRALSPAEPSGLTAAGREELKRLYRRAVKALHPDLHPEAEETENNLLQRAMEAYRHRDLSELRAVCEAIPDENADRPDALTDLRAEVRQLRRRIKAFTEELEELKQTNPYRLRVFLEDEAKAAAHREELLRMLHGYRESSRVCAEEIEAMLHPAEADE